MPHIVAPTPPTTGSSNATRPNSAAAIGSTIERPDIFEFYQADNVIPSFDCFIPPPVLFRSVSSCSPLHARLLAPQTPAKRRTVPFDQVSLLSYSAPLCVIAAPAQSLCWGKAEVLAKLRTRLPYSVRLEWRCRMQRVIAATAVAIAWARRRWRIRINRYIHGCCRRPSGPMLNLSPVSRCPRPDTS